MPFNAFGLFNYLNGQEQEDEKEKRLLLMKEGCSLMSPLALLPLVETLFTLLQASATAVPVSADVCVQAK